MRARHIFVWAIVIHFNHRRYNNCFQFTLVVNSKNLSQGINDVYGEHNETCIIKLTPYTCYTYMHTHRYVYAYMIHVLYKYICMYYGVIIMFVYLQWKINLQCSVHQTTKESIEHAMVSLWGRLEIIGWHIIQHDCICLKVMISL